MYRTLMLSALVALALTACKPTPRTALSKPRPPQQTEQAEQAAGDATAPEGPVAPEPPANPEAPVPGHPGASPAPAGPEAPKAPHEAVAASLLSISSTRQEYNRLRPWEKEDDATSEFSGVYLGHGQVLTIGNAALAATYVEISLPDGSRSVPARVLRYDRDLNLALLAPMHEKDLSIFDTRQPLELGEALKLGDAAAFDILVRGLIPVRIPLLAESCEVVKSSPLLHMPRLSLRAAQALPEGGVLGLPILREGKLAGLASGCNRDTQTLYCINAELLGRFLAAEDGVYASCPMIGIDFTGLNDPVLRAWLKLPEAQGGLYVNEVYGGGAAEQAGLREGDVVMAIDGLPIDTQGRCMHPLYGAIEARAVLRSIKPMDETLKLSISRDGERQELAIPLDRAALEQHLLGTLEPEGTQPRYVMWGGLLFQPMTQDYVMALMKRAKGTLPVQFLEAEEREKEFREKGVSELVMLTQVIPTPATLSYDGVGYCLVETVNGKPVHNFAEFVHLLDEPTPDGLVSFGLNKAPYTIYVDRRVAEAANSSIRRSAIQQLRNLGAGAVAPAEADGQQPAAATAPQE